MGMQGNWTPPTSTQGPARVTTKIRVAVVDKFPIMRDGIVQVLQREEDMEVVATGGTAQEANLIARELKPDIMIIDITIPGNGIAAVRQITKGDTPPKVVVLSLVDRRETVTAAMEAGASGYILKGVSGPELVRGIRIVHGDHIYLSRDLASRFAPSKKKRDP